MPRLELSSARRQPPWVLISLTLFLLLLPLALSKPGIPVSLKADEAAFYLASLSLWHDRDLVCDDHDVRRLFQEYSSTDNLLLMSKGKGQTVYFSIPIPYPLAATPFVALFGANGMVMLNAALLMAMVWMGFAHLRRYNSESLSTLFAVGFFLFSTAFVYMFWLQAEIFNMACVMAAFFLVERVAGGSASATRQPGSPRRLGLHAAGAAAMLVTAFYSKPMLAALALPLLYLLFRRSLEGRGDQPRSWRGLMAFAGAGLLTAVALIGTSLTLTEQPWPYLAPRLGATVSSPINYLERRIDPRLPEEAHVSAAFQEVVPGRQPHRASTLSVLLETAPEFLFGRHGGFLFYMPFAVLSIIFFLLHERRSVFRWLIFAAVVLTTVLFLTMVRGHWLGGGGFVGNRYFTAIYPCLIFLVRRLHPAGLTVLGYGAAAVFLGPLLITPLGAVVKEPTLQAHVRNQPFPHLPLEWSLARTLQGYRRISRAGVDFHGRRDEIMEQREEIWVHGAKRVEISLLSKTQDQSFVFDVRNLAPGNSIEICLQKDCRQLTFGDVPQAGSIERVAFGAQHAESVRRGGNVYRYRLIVTTEWGEQPRWRGSGKDRFYLGAALVLLGSPEDLARDLHDVEWLSASAPPSINAGSTVAVPISLRNSSPHAWPSVGATRVAVAYHWLTETGDSVIWDGKRTALPTDIAAGGTVDIVVRVDAPETAGRYILAFDLVRERVNWFSAIDDEMMHRMHVEIIATPAGLDAP